MKKATILTLTLCFSLSVFSQDGKTDKKFHLGFIGLGGLGWVSSETKNVSGSGLKGGLGIGIYGDYFFGDNYALSVEVLHSTQGFKVNANNISVRRPDNTTYDVFQDVSIDYRMRSFQVPLSIKLRTNEIGYWRYYGQIGIAPSFAYKAIKGTYSKNVFEKEDDNKDRLVNEFGDDFNAKDNISIPDDELTKYLTEDDVRGIRLPIIIGAGAEWNLSANTSILMGLRYEYGLTNLMKADNTVANPSVFNLVAGIRF